MNLLLFIFVAVSSAFVAVSSAFAGPLELQNTLLRQNTAAREEENTSLEQVIIDLIESLRDVMLNGSDDIPVLDPLNVEYLHLDLGSILDDLSGSHVTIRNAEVKQIATYQLSSLNMDIASVFPFVYRLDLEGFIPELDVDVENYDLDLSVLDYHIFGNGVFRLKVIEPAIVAQVDIGVSLTGLTITIRDVDVAFSVKGFEPVITGLFNNDAMSVFVSAFLKSFVPSLLDDFQEEISTLVNPIILDIAKEIVDGIDLGDLIDTNAEIINEAIVYRNLRV